MSTDVNPGAGRAQPAQRPWWERRGFLAALILISTVPLIYPPVPPLVDLLGHMGRYRVELDLANSPDLQRYFGFQWRPIGNLGVDLLVYPLGKLIGLEPAVKLIVMAIPPLTVAGFLWVAREVHHRLPPTALFALPFAYGLPFLYGFVNFALAMAFAFLAFGLWLRLGRLGRTRLRAALFVPISFIVFITHTFGWGTLGLLAFSAEAVRQHDQGIGWWKAALRAALHAAVMVGPLLLMLTWRSDIQQGMTADWFNLIAKGAWLLMALRDNWKWFDGMSVTAVVILLVEVRLWPRPTFSRNLAFSALVLFAVFLLLPRIVFGSAYADMRLVPYIFATAVLAIRLREDTHMRTARILAVVGLGFYLLRIASNTFSLAIAADDQAAKLHALDHVPRGARLVTLAWVECKDAWPLPRNAHLGGMAIVRRHAFSNDQWAIEGANLLSVRFAEAGHFKDDPSQMVGPDRCADTMMWRPEIALAAIPRDVFDYVWTIDMPPQPPRAMQGLQLVWEGNGSKLYRTEAGRRTTQP